MRRDMGCGSGFEREERNGEHEKEFMRPSLYFNAGRVEFAPVRRYSLLPSL